MPDVLNIQDHSRDAAGLVYVYPVVSRRAGGVSIGINLNTNNACNWRCVYCQVPGLKRGSAPPVDFQRLEKELRCFLQDVLHGTFMEEHVPPEARRLNDIALSGNGEPTSAKEFEQVIELVVRVRDEMGVPPSVKMVLITNGSLIHRAGVQRGLAMMAKHNGEVWFKLDSATPEGIARINGSQEPLSRVAENLRIATELCPTWIQTCMFQMDGQEPSEHECSSYLSFIENQLKQGVAIKGVLLYGLARPSMQPGSERLAPLPLLWMERFTKRIEALGLTVKLTL